jgi:hypothetical protein
MGIPISYGTRERLNLFLMFDQHREEHNLERHITRQVSTSRGMLPGCRKQFIERMLIFGTESPSISSPAGNLLLNQLCKRGKGAPLVSLFLNNVRAVDQL